MLPEHKVEKERECEHRWKFNGGNPFCSECGKRKWANQGRLVLPATKNDDGTFTVETP